MERHYRVRLGRHEDIDAVLALWAAAAENRDRRPDQAETAGPVRVNAMVLDDNELGEAAWHRMGYTLEPRWRRWVHWIDRHAG